MSIPLYIDTHAHLFSEEYLDDVDAVLQRAEQAGVKYIIVPATDLNTSKSAIQLAERYQNIFACIGIHPHEAAKASDNDLAIIEEMCSHPRVVAIGEIGMDYHYDFAPRDKQKEIFSAQIDIATRKNLPVVIHTRKSNQDVFEIVEKAVTANSKWKKSDTIPNRGVFHCFPGTAEEAMNLNRLGFFVSYPGIITFKKSESIEVVKKIGIKHILLETDSPYMAPVPLRGKRNEPSNIVHIGRKIAETLGISETEVARITSENAMNLFNLKWE
jgi:TatD DNase family protein